MRRSTMNSRIKVFSVILQGTALVLLCDWYMEMGPFYPVPSNDRVHVLLLSSWRSGSTFMGQVFSQNPSVFCLMEPSWHLKKPLRGADLNTFQTAVRDLLQSIFKCDLSVLETLIPKHPTVSSLFMWFRSRALCSLPACTLTSHNQIRDEAKCRRKCGAESLQRAQQTCTTYSHVVLKEVRLLDMKFLYPLMQDPDLNLHIVHLVRDPRAVLRSRMAVKKILRKDSKFLLEKRDIRPEEEQLAVMQMVCRSHMLINERAILNPPHFLKGRYIMIRYEDIVQDPLKEINDIYEFVGLEMTTELKAWIYNMTHGENRGKGHFKVTPRNATLVAQAWRHKLLHEDITKIQEMCKEAMTLLGYRAVYSEEEQKNLDLELVLSRDQHHFNWDPRKHRPWT